MALIIPYGPSFAYWTDNMNDVSAGSSALPGTGHNAGASSSDSTPGTILSALAHDCELLCIGWGGFSSSGVDHSTLLDVLVDPAGGTSWSELIANLLVGNDFASGLGTPFATPNGLQPFRPQWLYFPVWLPAGTSIGVRARTPAATPRTDSRIFMMAAGGNRNPASWWCGQKVETVGTINGTTCRGETIAPGVGSFTAWTDFGSTLSGNGGAAQFCIQGTATTTQTGNGVVFEFGVGGTKIGPSFWRTHSTGECGSVFTYSGPLFHQLPAGAQMQVRAKQAVSTAQDTDFAAYVVM